jgi:predicted PurR-regulated permease PerM
MENRRMVSHHHKVLVLITAGILLIALAILSGVIGTVFFAVTLGYVLFPARRWLVAKGLSPRVASGLLTIGVFVLVVVLLLPPVFIVFERRETIITFLQTLPPTLSVGVEGFTIEVQTGDLVRSVGSELRGLTVRIARGSIVIGLKFILFAFVLYAILFRPEGVRAVTWAALPEHYHDLVESFHERTSRTLYGLYVVQVLTGTLTFLIALPVFFFLGYKTFFTLSLIAGILQFLPVVGPSVVVAGLAMFDLATGNPMRAAMVAGFGIVLVGALPDAILRPKLANRTAGMAASLYFIGFTGGVLSLGPIGIIAGPLVIALLLEAVEQLTPSEGATGRS